GVFGEGGDAVGRVLHPGGGAVPDGAPHGAVPGVRGADLRGGGLGVLLRAGAEVPSVAEALAASAGRSAARLAASLRRAVSVAGAAAFAGRDPPRVFRALTGSGPVPRRRPPATAAARGLLHT